MAAHAQTLQERIDAASPGETIVVSAGTYARPVTVDKAIVLQGEGEVRLAGLSGSLATVENITFDGSLVAQPAIITAGTDLTLTACEVTAGVAGLAVVGTGVQVLNCNFTDVVTAITLLSDTGLEMIGGGFLNCDQGVVHEADIQCTDGSREPASSCQGPCAPVTLTNVSFDGGTRHLVLAGNWQVEIKTCNWVGATESSIEMRFGDLTIEDSQFTGAASGTGLRLDGVTGSMVRSTITAWTVGIQVGDGGCPTYSTFSLGGSLDTANTLGGVVALRLTQPEGIPAEVNYWGSIVCSVVQGVIEGQHVFSITDQGRNSVLSCEISPVERITWGRLRSGAGWRSNP